MKASLTFLLIAANVPSAYSVGAQTNPLSKVIQLLDDLAAKIVADGEAEAKAYKEYFEWCDDAAMNAKFDIETGTKQKAKLEAKISESDGDIEATSNNIEELTGAIQANSGELKSATEIRDKEVEDFSAAEAELMEAIDTLSRAITILDREYQKNPAAFTQVDTTNMQNVLQALSTIIDAASFSNVDRQKLLALVQAQQDDADVGAPAATVYKSHSANIIEVLEDMKEKAEEQLSDLRKAEANTRHNFDMLKQSLDDQNAHDTKNLDAAKAGKAAAEEAKAAAEGDLAGTEKDLANSKQLLETTQENCMQVATDHDATVKARDEELKVIAEARQILVDTTAGAESQTYSFLQVMVGSRLHTSTDLVGAEAVDLVKKLAREQNSMALAQLASRMAAIMKYGAANGDDPFAKVKGLIQNLIARLEREAEADATEKAYCDEEMAKTESKKQELDDDIEKLTVKIDQASARSAELKEQVKELEDELTALAKLQAEMDKTRQEEHDDYVQAKADLEQGLEGVRKALTILRDYYANGGEEAFMQQPAKPETFKKAEGAGQSIIGILEVVESDFADNLSKEETQEADAAQEYEKVTQENSVAKATKEQDVKYKTQEFKGLDKAIVELSGDRKAAHTELDAVMEYYGKLKERCIAKPETYEERQKRRAAEIAGLKEALSILNGPAALLQRKGQSHLRGVL